MSRGGSAGGGRSFGGFGGGGGRGGSFRGGEGGFRVSGGEKASGAPKISRELGPGNTFRVTKGAEQVAASAGKFRAPREAAGRKEAPAAEKGRSREKQGAKEKEQRKPAESRREQERPEQEKGDRRTPLEKLREKILKVEEMLYWIRHEDSSPRGLQKRQQLERIWNRLKARELKLMKAEKLRELEASADAIRAAIARCRERGGLLNKLREAALNAMLARNLRSQTREAARTWTYKRDARDDWTFGSETVERAGRAMQRAFGRGRIPDPATVINWRKDTIYGEQREAAIRSSLPKGRFDHAGHLIKAEWGADPEGVNGGEVNREGINPKTGKAPTRYNYGAQNWRMNLSTGWKNVETALTNAVRGSHSRTMEITVTSHSSTRTSNREYSRTVTAFRQNPRTGEWDQPVTLTVKDSRPENGVRVKQDVQVPLNGYRTVNPQSPPPPSRESE